MSLFKRALTIATAAVALSASSAALADAIVVRSSGPSAATYPVGHRLPTTGRIVLRAGDRVVLVGEGGSRTLAGPGNFPVRAAPQQGQGRGATLNRFLSASGGSISRTGAVRGTEGPATPPSLWVIDIARGGTFCAVDLADVTLWRADPAGDTLFMVDDVNHPGTQASVAFVAGQNFRRWPSESLPVSEGAAYSISGPGLTEPTRISVVSIGSPPTDVATIATALADKGCTAQLALLGDELANSAP